MDLKKGVIHGQEVLVGLSYLVLIIYKKDAAGRWVPSHIVNGYFDLTYRVEIDAFGNVWCGDFYLSFFDTKLKRFAAFNNSDGLQGHSFGTASSCKDAEGNLYFGGSHGFNYFKPQAQIPVSAKLKAHFSRVCCHG